MWKQYIPHDFNACNNTMVKFPGKKYTMVGLARAVITCLSGLDLAKGSLMIIVCTDFCKSWI